MSSLGLPNAIDVGTASFETLDDWTLLRLATTSTTQAYHSSTSLVLNSRFGAVPPNPDDSEAQITINTVPGLEYRINFWVFSDEADPESNHSNTLHAEYLIPPSTWVSLYRIQISDPPSMNEGWYNVGYNGISSIGTGTGSFTALDLTTTIRLRSDPTSNDPPYPLGNEPYYVDLFRIGRSHTRLPGNGQQFGFRFKTWHTTQDSGMLRPEDEIITAGFPPKRISRDFPRKPDRDELIATTRQRRLEDKT